MLRKGRRARQRARVSIVRVVSFSESAAGIRVRWRTAWVRAQAMDPKPFAPEISIGQNKVQNDVSVTYEIRLR